jgi:hypothetical protein
MGKYLHYLPTFLHDLPILLPSLADRNLMEKYVDLMLEEFDETIDKKIDELVYKIHGCTEKEIKTIEQHITIHLIK